MALLLAPPPQLCAQGFGMIKMHVTLQRKRPPDVYLLGTAFDVRVEAADNAAGQITRDFETLLANEMCRNDNRLHVEKRAPETLVEVTVANLGVRQNWTTRRSTEYRKVGTKQVWNEKKRVTETKDDYQNVEVQKRYLVVDGALTTTLRVVESAGKKVLHSGTFNDSYNKEFLDGVGAPGEGQVAVMLMQSAVRRALPAVVPTNESLQVQLAKGKLEDSSKLAQSGLWTRMLEMLETMAPLSKREDEAYRQYNLGVASEALAYQAEEAAAGLKLLEQAAVYYGKAIDAKPDEKYFREPQVRIQTAIAHAGRTEGQRALYSRTVAARQGQGAIPAARPGGGIAPDPEGSRSTITPANEAFTNRSVIDLVTAGLDEGNLIAMIHDAPAVKFDLSPQATVTLLQNKVTNRVIAAMRARAAKK
jgi:hypothetical protein